MVLTFLVLTMMPIPVMSQQAGLSEGQVAQYQVTGDPALTVNVTRSELIVIDVQGTIVTIRDTDEYLDGSSNEETIQLDLATGQSNATFQGYYFAIRPGLGVGDPIYPGSNIIVQRNESRQYAGSGRQVNVYENLTDSSEAITYYWDRETGIYTEIVRSQGGLGFHVNMTSTNIWASDQQIPQNTGSSYLISLLIGLLVVVAVLWVYVLKVRKRTRE